MTWKDLNSETEAHIEERALDLMDVGVAEREAWARARREFGNATQVIEASREVWVWTWLEHLMQDVRYAVRAMTSNKLFTGLAVLSLALGIGANTAIYSFMDAILLRSLPVQDPKSLAVLKFQVPAAGKGETRGTGSRNGMNMHITSGGSRDGVFSAFPYPAFEIFQTRSDLFSAVFAYHGVPETRLVVDRQATLGDCIYVSGDYFRGLGVKASAGRMLTADDDRLGAAPAAVISLAFAQQHYGSADGALGKAVAVNGFAFTVAGIVPAGFFGANPEWTPAVYVPLHSYLLTQPPRFTEDGKLFLQPSTYWMDVMARLKPGVTRQQAQAALDPVFVQYFAQNASNQQEEPEQEKPRMVVMEGAGGLDSLRANYSQPLYVLMTMVALILVIACANIANLLLARASARRREMAVRLSMGAGRWRVIRQLLTESTLLSITGGALGLLIAGWGVRTLTALLAMGREDFTLRAGLNWSVLAVTFAVALATGILFGLAPAWQSTKVDVFSALKETRSSGGAAAAPRRWRGWRPVSLGQALIVGQITLSLLLLMGAGLFVRTLVKLQSRELGFNAENLLLLEVNTQQAGYKGPASLQFHEVLRQRFAAVPGVKNATLAGEGQLDGGSWNLEFTVPGSRAERTTGAPLLPVGPGYLATMQIPILKGRDIRVEDGARKPAVAVVSEAFAKKHFGSDNPIGRRVSMRFGGAQELEIVGVAGNARYANLKDDPPAMLYVDYRHNPGFLNGVIRIILRTTGSTSQMASAARQILRETDPGVPLGMVMTQTVQIESTIAQEILFARLCTVFAALALLIACVGLYGTTAYSVARRTGEIGVRMALGAQRNNVVAMVMREVAALALVALAVGIPLALGASKLVAAFLFELQPNDPATITGAIAILMTAALLAAFAPAHRASRIDPIQALRHE